MKKRGTQFNPAPHKMEGDAMYPQAREDRLLIEHLSDETLVYDLERHKAHCLNGTSAFVWRHCDGQTSVAELARMGQDEFGIPVNEENEEMVWLALDRLERADLLRERMKRGDLPQYSRRQLMRTLGRIGIAIPVVMSIVSPTAVQAASLLDPADCAADPATHLGKCCTNNRPCKSNGNCAGPNC